MRVIAVGLVAALILAGCSKKPEAPAKPGGAASNAPATAPATPAAPTAPSGPAVSGVFTGNGKPSTLTQVTAHKGEPFDDQPVTELVFTAKDQGADADAEMQAHFGKYGDSVVARVTPDGNVIGADIRHSGLNMPGGSVSLSGMISIKDYKNAGGQISGRLTTGGPTDVFGQTFDMNLTFHTKAP